MVGKTRKKKRKKYFRLKKNRSWFSVVMFSITSLVSAVAIIAFASIFLIFMVNSHIEKEYESKASLVKLYEDGVSSDGYTVFDSTGMDYFIKEDGNVIHSKGLITCSDIGAQYTLSYDDKSVEGRSIYIYADSVNKIIVPDNDGDISVDAVKFVRKMGSAAQICFGKDRPTHNISVIDLPVWISVEMNGGQDLVFKSVISIMSEDMTMVFAMMIMLLILFGAVLVTMIVNAAKSASDQHRINSLFFTDIRIKAHNWLWFVYYAEQKLGGKRDAKKKYAIADVEFVGFRRYCVCNTIDEGEILLKKIYDSLCGLIGKDELCAHDSDGKFALLLEYSDTKALKERMDQMLSVLSKTAGSKNLAFHAGIAPAHNEGGKRETDIESDHANACAACATLEDKEGTGTAFYDEEIVKEQRWIETVSQLQQKAADNEEFVVYYQPKYDPRTNILSGAEALIRWQSPEHGFLSPYKFIPIFEKNGFITEIDHYMIRHAARDQKRWLDEGLRCVPVSVNVSRAHFIEDDLAEQIRDIVDAEGTPHELIEIELTESAFFDDKRAMLDTITRLQGYGFAVSMDDFGSGYSSLNSLKDMPLDILKLDAGFFKGDAADTDRGEIVVSEAIKLAKSLDMRTVAEGVESREQVDFLASKGCDMIQGYYFAKPMPGNEYEERIRSGRSEHADDDEKSEDSDIITE